MYAERLYCKQQDQNRAADSNNGCSGDAFVSHADTLNGSEDRLGWCENSISYYQAHAENGQKHQHRMCEFALLLYTSPPVDG